MPHIYKTYCIKTSTPHPHTLHPGEWHAGTGRLAAGYRAGLCRCTVSSPPSLGEESDCMRQTDDLQPKEERLLINGTFVDYATTF